LSPRWPISIIGFFGFVFIALGEDQTQPIIRSMIGGMFFDSDHSYVAESEVKLPLLRREPFSLSYRYHEITPVLKRESQTQLLFSRYNLEADLTLSDPVRLIAIGGYRTTSLEDRPGSFNAYEFGLGVGSPLRRELPALEWSALVGGYVSPERLNSDWWADLHANWRIFQFEERRFLDTAFKPSLGLALDIESSNEGGHFRAMYKFGPVLELMSGNGNRARFHARYYVNDGNPFFENRYSGLLVGVEVNASLDEDTLFDARSQRQTGWLPLVWGQYDVGAGNDRALQRTELNAEIHDFSVADHPITAILWYESRQEQRPASGIVAQLTNRELQVFRLAGLAQPTRVIAEKLGVSVKTIETHRENIKNKLDLDSHAELVARAAQWLRENDGA